MKTTLLAAIAAAALASCASEAHKSYFLEPDGPAPASQGVMLGIGPIRIPEYLDRREIAVETAPHQLDYATNHLWAGSLDQQIGATLGQNLGRRLGTGSIQQYPWDSQTPVRYQVSVDVQRFHARLGGSATLDASWRVYDLQAKRLVSSRSSHLSETLTSDGYGAASAAQSQLISRLAAEIAATIPGR